MRAFMEPSSRRSSDMDHTDDPQRVTFYPTVHADARRVTVIARPSALYVIGPEPSSGAFSVSLPEIDLAELAWTFSVAM